jgi:hypothetical protein
MAGWNQAAAQQSLLVLAVQHDNPHYQVLILAKQRRDFGTFLALSMAHILPPSTQIPETFQGFVQFRQQDLASLVKLELRRLVRTPQRLVFLFG